MGHHTYTPKPHPHTTTALLAVAAAALTANTTESIPTAALAITLAIIIATKHGLPKNLDRRTRLRIYTFITAATAWFTTMATLTITLESLTVLTLLTAALAGITRRLNKKTTQTPSTVTSDAAEYINQWAQHIGGPGGVLEGSRLTKPEKIKSGYRYILKLRPGRHTYEGVMASMGQIRTGMHLMTYQDAIVEIHPDLPASCLSLTIVTERPIATSIDWPGPIAFDTTTGKIDLGPYIDGEGVAQWRVFSKNSIWGGYISGGSGSGKSRVFDSVALSAANAGCCIWFMDGDEGASSAMLTQYADYTCVGSDIQEARVMLANALLIMRIRRAENKVYGWDGFTHTNDRPGILIFMDECHVFFADSQCQKMAAEISRRGRKVGVAIIAASQVATLDAFGGAGGCADVLRSQLLGGNGLVLRSKSSNMKLVFGIDINPKQFPADIEGYAYYVAQGAGEGRTAPYRGYFVSSDVAEKWGPVTEWRALPEGEANALDGYSRRREAAEEGMEETKRWLETMKSGATEVVAKAIQESTHVPTAPGVAQFPVWVTPTPQETHQVRPIHEKIMAAIRTGEVLKEGYTKPSLLAKTLGYSERHIHEALKQLVDMDVVETGNVQGRYYPTGTPLPGKAA